MTSSVNGTAGGTGNATTAARLVEAKRQEILQSAQAQGGAQARAVQAGKRRAAASQRFRAPAQAAGQTSGTTSKSQTSPTQTAGQAKKVGWEVALDDKSFAAMKQATAGQSGTGKGMNLDVLV